MILCNPSIGAVFYHRRCDTLSRPAKKAIKGSEKLWRRESWQVERKAIGWRYLRVFSSSSLLPSNSRVTLKLSLAPAAPSSFFFDLLSTHDLNVEFSFIALLMLLFFYVQLFIFCVFFSWVSGPLTSCAFPCLCRGLDVWSTTLKQGYISRGLTNPILSISLSTVCF